MHNYSNFAKSIRKFRSDSWKASLALLAASMLLACATSRKSRCSTTALATEVAVRSASVGSVGAVQSFRQVVASVAATVTLADTVFAFDSAGVAVAPLAVRHATVQVAQSDTASIAAKVVEQRSEVSNDTALQTKAVGQFTQSATKVAPSSHWTLFDKVMLVFTVSIIVALLLIHRFSKKI